MNNSICLTLEEVRLRQKSWRLPVDDFQIEKNMRNFRKTQAIRDRAVILLMIFALEVLIISCMAYVLK